MTPLGAHPGTGHSARRPEGRPDLHCHSAPSVRPRVDDTATRARAYRSYCHSGLNAPCPHVHRRVAVQTILPLTLERTDRTATRPRAYRFGTFDAIWQCKLHCHSAPSVRPRVGGTATRARTFHYHTFTAEWQCKLHCHSPSSVPIALPLGPERTALVRSMPFGSVRRAATRP